MHVLAAQLVYLLQRGEVHMVIAAHICHELYRTGARGETFREDALVMGVDHELELW